MIISIRVSKIVMFSDAAENNPVPGRMLPWLSGPGTGSTLARKAVVLFLVFCCGAQREERGLDQQAFIQARVDPLFTLQSKISRPGERWR